MAKTQDVQQFLSTIDYPTDKSSLVEHAREEGAPSGVVETLQQLPDRDYDSPTDVSAEISGRASDEMYEDDM